MAVNSLLVTRAFNGTPPDTVEDVAFGYSAGIPEAPYAAGNVQGATSAAADATIVVLMKGDFSGNGLVEGNDLSAFNAAKTASGNGTASQLQIYTGDFSGNRLVEGNELGSFNSAKNNSLVCP